MNVLLLNTYPHGGAGIACQRLQIALKESEVEVSLLTMDQVPGKWPFYAERLSFLPYERDKSVRFSFSLANFGHNICKHPAVQKADILHLHWINQGFLSLRNIQQLSQLGKPIVWTLHDMWAFTGGCHYSGACRQFLQECGQCPYLWKPGPKDLSHRIWKRKQAQFPTDIQFVTCSEWLAQTARQSGLLKKYLIVSIPNPIDTQLFAPTTVQEQAAYKKEHQIGTEAFLLLFVAMNVREERKGFKYLKEALELLKDRSPEIPIELIVLGRASAEDLEALPYPSHLLGMIKDKQELAAAYSVADAFVIPSLEDNLPNTVMESLSCGTPVVGFETGGIPEMVDHLLNGFIAPQRNSAALAEGINWLFSLEPAAKEQLRQTARDKVEKQYSHSTIAEQYISLYQSLMAKTGL